MARRSQVDDAHIGARLLGRLLHRGKEQLRQECVTHMVGAELNFITLLSLIGGASHYPGIVDKDMQTRRRRLENLTGIFHGLKRGEVERQVSYLRVWDIFFDVRDGVLCFALRTCP